MLRAIAPLASAFVCFAGFTGFASADVEEGPRTLFGQPVAEAPELSEEEIEARRLGLEAMFEEKGWEKHGNVVGPAELFADSPEPQAANPADWNFPPHRATIFLNFFGGEMTNGTNAAKMESGCINGTVNYPGFNGGEAKALAIVEVFESKLEPYGIRVAYDKVPPPELPYQMVMMGGQPQDVGFGGGTLGVSCSSDCGDRWWRDTTLAFTEASSQTNTLATVALQEAAHAFGLGHIDGQNMIMYPYATPGSKVWAQGCTDYNDATGPINCKPTHDIWCGGEMQDDNAELLAYFGANSPDTEPPVVEILTPEDGIELPPGSSVELEAEITDNHDGAGWKLMIYQDGNLVDDRPSFVFEKSWTLNGLPEGTYVLRVQAIDHDRNIGAAEVTVYVGTPEETTESAATTETESSGTDGSGTDGSGTDGSDSDGSGSDGSASGNSASGNSDSGNSDTSLPTTATATAGEDGGDEMEGCACASAQQQQRSGGMWLLAGLLGLLGRRRRR